MRNFLKILILVIAGVRPGAVSGQTLTGAHDPTVLKDDRCVYSLLCTNNLLQIRQSTDEVNWKSVGNIFPAVPAWVNAALGATIPDIWAPCIRYNNGLYWVYYACSSFGTNNSVIGVASNPTLNPTAANYKWTDQGIVIQSGSANNYNCIDPDMVVDSSNNVWLLFGSFWSGIKMISIDPATGKQSAANKTIYSLASRGGGAIEGAALLQHGGYNYLFTSWDTCCQGVSSTYNTRMGRSSSVTGPYVDEAGTALMSSGGTKLLSSYAQYIGPGGGEAFQDGRRSYFAHHYYDANHNGAPELQIREIVFDNSGWCQITQPYLGRHQAFEAEHAHLANVAVSQTASASNGDYVTGITAAGSQVVFYVNALAAGNYEAAIRYANTGTAATETLTVNGGPAISVAYPSTGGTLQFSAAQAVTMNVTLAEGYNVLTFQPGTGSVALDRMDLIRSAGDVTAAGSDDHDCSLVYQPADNSAVFSPGGDAQYENLDFKTGGYTSLSVYFSGSCTGPLTFTLDSLTGTLAAATNVTVAGPQTIALALPAAFKNTTGVHDLFAQFNGTGSCAVGGFQFTAQLVGSTNTFTPSPSNTATRTPVPPTPTFSPSNSPTRTATFSATATSTTTRTSTPTSSPTPSVSMTPSPSPTGTFTSTRTNTSSHTSTMTFSATPSPTHTVLPTSTASATASASASPSDTASRTPTDSLTPTASTTSSPTWTGTSTPTPTATPSFSPTPSVTATFTLTATRTTTLSPTAFSTATLPPSDTPSRTPTLSFSSTASFTRTSSSTLTPTATSSFSPTPTYTATITPTVTKTSTSSPTAMPSNTPSWTPTASFTSTPAATFTGTKTVTSTASNTPSSTPMPSPTGTSTPTLQATSMPGGKGSIVIYPNPAQSSALVTLQLTLPAPAEQIQVLLYTLSFRQVNEISLFNIPGGDTDISLPLFDRQGHPLANGIYYVVVRTSRERLISKLMILR